MFVCIALFIIACGATHDMEIWTLWTPVYGLSGAIKAITAAASVPTAILLIRLVPHALAIPTRGSWPWPTAPFATSKSQKRDLRSLRLGPRMPKAFIIGLWLGAVGCGNSPSYTVPASPLADASAAGASFTAAMRCATTDLGTYDEKLCLLGFVSGKLQSYAVANPATGPFGAVPTGGALDAASATGCPAGSNATSPVDLGTSVALFVDGDRHWQLAASGLDVDDLTAIVQCQPWSAFGLAAAPPFSRIDERVTTCAPQNPCGNTLVCGPSCTTTVCGVIGDGCGGVIDCGPCPSGNGGASALYPGYSASADDAGPTWQETSPVPAGAACVLSAVGGDFFGTGSASVGSGGLFATAGAAYAGGPETLSVSATCFEGVAFVDVALDSNAAVPLPRGLCGLASLADMNTPSAEVSVLGSTASTVTAAASARCVLYRSAMTP